MMNQSVSLNTSQHAVARYIDLMEIHCVQPWVDEPNALGGRMRRYPLPNQHVVHVAVFVRIVLHVHQLIPVVVGHHQIDHIGIVGAAIEVHGPAGTKNAVGIGSALISDSAKLDRDPACILSGGHPTAIARSTSVRAILRAVAAA